MLKFKILLPVSLIGTIMALSLIFFVTQNNEFIKDIHTLEGGWSFYYNGEKSVEQPSDELGAFIFPRTIKGDTLVLIKQLTQPYDSCELIAFDTWHSITNVYIDNTLIYTNGEQLYASGQMVGSARHHVALPDNFIGKELKIELITTENGSMPNMPSVACYKAGDMGILWFNRPVVLLLIGLLVLLFGMGTVFASCSFASKKSRFIEPLMLGISIILMGIYILCRGNYFQLLIHNPLIYNTIEYISLYSIPIPVLFYLHNDVSESRSRYVKIIYAIGLTICSGFIVVALILNFTTSIHLSSMLTPFYIVAICFTSCFFYIISACRISYDLKRKRIYMLGISSFVGSSMLSITAFMLCYNTYWASALQLWKWYNYILPLSLCTLSAFLMAAFYSDLKKIIEKSYRSELLNYIAYFDALTHISNRRAFDEDILQLNNKGSGVYSLISADLNNLKHVNDTIGHNSGDNMLKAFADALSNACGDGIKAYRLGGDEFAVIVPTANCKICADIVKKLENEIASFNEARTDFTVSAAVGYADSTEENSPDLVFELADKRMYENKAKIKADKQGLL